MLKPAVMLRYTDKEPLSLDFTTMFEIDKRETSREEMRSWFEFNEFANFLYLHQI